MSRSRPQWQLQALAAQRRDAELRRAEELKKVANYFECNTNRSRQVENWTTPDYYAKANKEAELLSQRKIRTAQLEERRKKLELMLYQENMEHQQELKMLASQPKLYKNGSYLNTVPTSTLKEINVGIMQKEEELQRHEAELRLHHAWRLKQPELRATQSFLGNQKLKSAWMEQIVERQLEKEKEEEEIRNILNERDEMLRKQLDIEQQKSKLKEQESQELRDCLENQIAHLKEKESVAKRLRTLEEKERMFLEDIKIISEERERKVSALMSQQHNKLINMGLHKYKLKRKVQMVLKEIDLDLQMLDKIKHAFISDTEAEGQSKCKEWRVVESAQRAVAEQRDTELQRQRAIDAMYDGEARQLNEKQELLWAKEREARAILITEVVTTLQKQLEEKIEARRQEQKENVLEREKILNQVDDFHNEVKTREREKELKSTAYSTIASIQSQLNELRVEKQRLEKAREGEAETRAALDRERRLRREIALAHRAGTAAWT